MPHAFSLDALLQLRQHKEDAEERQLLSLATHRQQVEATLGRVRQQLLLWQEERQREIGSVGRGSTQQGTYARLGLLRHAEEQLMEQQRELQQRSRERQASYLAARRDREVLSNLKQSHREGLQRDLARQEQLRLEDLLLGRWPMQQGKLGKK